MLIHVSLFCVSPVSKGALLSYPSVAEHEAPASRPCDGCVVADSDGD